MTDSFKKSNAKTFDLQAALERASTSGEEKHRRRNPKWRRLTAEVYKAKEPEFRAALAAEPDPEETRVEGDPEARELAQLTERANVGDILSRDV